MAERVVFLVDMQSFYASVEKADRPELRDVPVVVAGDPQRRSGVVLAACPLAKASGVETGERLGQALQKCPEATVVRPRMQRYLDVSLQITDILERFTDLVEPYSIDEQFLDVTGSQGLFGEPLTIARRIQEAVLAETGVWARIGIGPNKVLAKMACDNFAKKRGDGVFRLTDGNLRECLWPLPVECLFGVGLRMARHLRGMGIHTIGELATCPVARLTRRWGVRGQVLWTTAHGIDPSPVSPDGFAGRKSIGRGMTLPRDYREATEIRVVLLELSDEVCRQARGEGLVGVTVAVGCRGSFSYGYDLEPLGGFYRQTTLPQPTNDAADVFRAAWWLFERHWDRRPVRRLAVVLSG
ncbi:MAG: DNA polymerase IV, partial [Clostridia bacterium]|nr:DNA polymerase IV [Clostridia bacterium]